MKYVTLVASVLVIAGIASWIFVVSADDENAARDTHASYAPSPGPTPTPIEAPVDASLIDANQARRALLELHARAYGEVDANTVSADRMTAAELDPNLVPQRATDYPVWVLTAQGEFHPRSLPLGAEMSENQYTEMTAIIDAVDGTLIGVTLSNRESASD